MALLAAPLWLLTASAEARDAATTLTLHEGKMIEAAFFKVKPGMEDRLAERYFPKALALAASYGMRPLTTFRVEKVEHGPHGAIAAWGLFEWPDVETKERFERDKRFRKLRRYRDSLLETLPRQVYLQVNETVRIPLRADGYYEAAVAWAHPERSKHMQQYFSAAGPFVQERGVKFLGDFRVVGQPEDPRYAFDSLPNTFLLIDWGAEGTKEAWFGSEQFRQVGWHRALALDRLFIVESSWSPPSS